MRDKALNILKYFLVALFISYYAESTLFYHTHTFAWGTVTHSHPYLPNSTHSHSTTTCQAINALNDIQFVIVATVAITISRVIHYLFYKPCLQSFARYVVTNCSLRAPPLFAVQ